MALKRPCNLRLGPRKFKHFPKLPIELRLAIWEFALPNAQLISIKSERGPDPHKAGRTIITRDVCAWYKVPTLLHVSQEARVFAQSIYQQKFGDRLGGNGVWMDLTKDILCFDDVSYDAMLGFLVCDLGNPRYNAPGNVFKCRDPITDILPALAFKYFPWPIPCTPQTFTKLGRPQKIYLLRYAGPVPFCQERMHRRVSEGWQNSAVEAKDLSYAEPAIQILTYKKMKDELASFSDSGSSRNSC